MDLVIPKHIEKKYPDYKKKLACWNKKYFVIVKPTERGYKRGGSPVRLIIDFDGTKKYGKEIYDQNSEELENKITDIYKYLWYNYIYEK
tara:strand:+ start:679 stop:945 length:267 start_codon:yes stop_codon:yes gene_type:complete